jgi:hypothetical protein
MAARATVPSRVYWLIFLRRDRGQELHDDRGRDVGHDAQGEHRHPADGTAGEHIHHAQHATGMLLEDLRESLGVDTGQRDIGPDTGHDQQSEREPDPLFELFRLGEGAEIDIGGKLFGG